MLDISNHAALMLVLCVTISRKTQKFIATPIALT